MRQNETHPPVTAATTSRHVQTHKHENKTVNSISSIKCPQLRGFISIRPLERLGPGMQCSRRLLDLLHVSTYTQRP